MLVKNHTFVWHLSDLANRLAKQAASRHAMLFS